MRSWTASLVAALALTGCAVTPPGDEPIKPLRGPLPISSKTPMSDALACLAKHIEAPDLRLAVHSIPDRTGVADYDGPGAYATQGAELMMVTALGKSGIRQVNRTATNIAEWELAQALDQRLGEGRPVKVGDKTFPFRPVQMGTFLGSTHTLYGGITELDFDIASGGAEVEIAGVGVKARGYYVSIGLDLVVADSRSTEIVLTRSYRKQIWGQEVEGSVFRFWDIGNGGDSLGDLGLELFDLRVGQQQNEPLQASIRWVVELAAYEIVRELAGVEEACEIEVPRPGKAKSEPAAVAAAAAAAVDPEALVTEDDSLPATLDETGNAAERAAPATIDDESSLISTPPPAVLTEPEPSRPSVLRLRNGAVVLPR